MGLWVMQLIERNCLGSPACLFVALALVLGVTCDGKCPNGEVPHGGDGTDQKEVAAYVRDNLLDGEFGARTLWMTETDLDDSHIARDMSPEVPDIRFPFARTWLVMIDDQPEANWGHTCRWLFVNAELSEHTEPVVKDFPPRVFSNLGKGPEVGFACVDVTPTKCP